MNKNIKNTKCAPLAHMREALPPNRNGVAASVRTLIGHSDKSEKIIEKYLVKKIGELGMPCLKYSNPGMTGYPDRIVVRPFGNVVWVELKSTGKKPSPNQKERIKQLNSLGHSVWVIDSKAGVDELINLLRH